MEAGLFRPKSIQIGPIVPPVLFTNSYLMLRPPKLKMIAQDERVKQKCSLLPDSKWIKTSQIRTNESYSSLNTGTLFCCGKNKGLVV